MSKEIPYWQQRQQMKLTSKPPASVNKAESNAIGAFFTEQIANAPAACEECGKSLAGTKAINPAAIVAHILPKSKKQGCPSVALHPLNKVFLCIECHTNFDTKGEKYVKKMRLFPVLKELVSKFYDEIAEKELRRVPEYFRPAGK